MKIIYPNNGVLNSATSELDSAPAANITESHANNPWMADVSDGSPSVTIDVTEGSAVLVYKILADACTVTVKYPGGSTITSESYTLTLADTYGVERHIDHIWLEYPEQSSHQITVALTKGSYAYAGIGIIYAGKLRGAFSDPLYGDISIDGEDHSIMIQLSGGVEHPITDSLQRIYSATLQISDSDEFDAIRRLGRMLGKSRPFGCKMHETATPADEWLIYARFDNPPKSQPVKYRQNTIAFNLKEFL